MIEVALIAALVANPGVAALVSGRVFIFGGRQGALYPYITIQRISTTGAAHLTGPATLEWPRFQIDCWAETALAAGAAADAVRTALDAVEITGSPTFTATFQDQRGPFPDEDTRTFRTGQDYLVFYERA